MGTHVASGRVCLSWATDAGSVTDVAWRHAWVHVCPRVAGRPSLAARENTRATIIVLFEEAIAARLADNVLNTAVCMTDG